MKEAPKINHEATVSFFLRSGLTIVFLYAGIAALLDPIAWEGFIPQFIRHIIPADIFIHIHSTGNIIIGLWLLSNKKAFYPSVLAALAMLSIIVFNIAQLDIVFRDVAIIFMAIALTFITYEK